MRTMVKSKLLWIVLALLRRAPAHVGGSMALKLCFIVLQLSSISLIVAWAGGNLPPGVERSLGWSGASLGYPAIAAIGLLGSSVVSLWSKGLALKGIFRFESILSGESTTTGAMVSVGDHRNIAKLLLSLIDAFIPALFVAAVAVAWSWLFPSLMVPLLLLFAFLLLLARQGVSFSAKKYRPMTPVRRSGQYVGSEQQAAFYRILMLPQYISVAVFGIVSFSLVFCVVGIKLYLDSGGKLVGVLPIATVVALLQLKTVVGIIVRAGAYARTIEVVSAALAPKGAK